MYDYVIAYIPLNVILLIISVSLFINQLNANSQNLKYDNSNVTRFIIILINMFTLILVYQTVTKKRFGALYTFGFVLILSIYYSIKLIKYIYKRVKRFLSFRVKLLICLVIFIIIRHVYKDKVLHSCKKWNEGLS